MKRRALIQSALALAAAPALAPAALARSAASGYAVAGYASQTGPLGAVLVNPYGIAPLTAVILAGGYELLSASVRVRGRDGGPDIAYKVSRRALLTHGGVPVFGLYGDYRNQVDVTARRVYKGKAEEVAFTYTIYANPVVFEPSGAQVEAGAHLVAEVKKVDPEFRDRLYFVNNYGAVNPKANRVVWNNPMGGALTWNFPPENVIIDTKGDVRWYLDFSRIWNPESIYSAGIVMGFRQNEDGALSFGYGQNYAKYDLMGRKVFTRRLPEGYCDFSHDMDAAQNGHYFLRVASNDYRRADGKRVRTVRDIVIEVDQGGNVVDEWRLFDILDPYRSAAIEALDQGAVCLNIDPAKAGRTLSAEELAAQEQEGDFGDAPGVGPGRNWLHVNSIDYDPSDDSIIISARHQCAVIKIGRDKQVKWILGAPKGWRSPWKEKLLAPASSNGSRLACTETVCENTDFDWPFTQHSAFRIDEKSDKRFLYLSVFDNGDARNLEQPALPEMKYSRAVVYRIDQEKGLVSQVWEYGKERGHEWYSPITSVNAYAPDKDSLFVYSATAGLDLTKPKPSLADPFINEFKWGAKEPSVEIRLRRVMGYRVLPIELKKAFEQ